MILADHGAEVISIESKRFQSDDLYFKPLNRNKKHISLNLKTREGKEIFFKLVKTSDVIIEGFRPGVCKKLGIHYEAAKSINPRIIYCSITGYGQTGPLKDLPGHDINYLSKSGVLSLIGESQKPPTIPGVQIADIIGGGLHAVIGILLALQARHRFNTGQYVDISMTDAAFSLLISPLFFKGKGFHYERGDSFLSHRYACYNTYETSDKRYLAIGALEKRFWKNLCNYFGKPEYIPLQYDDNHRLEILAYMKEKFGHKPLAYWVNELQNKDACMTACATVEEALTDPLFKEREMVLPANGTNSAPTQMIGVPVKLSKTPGKIKTLPMNFGENTTGLLKAFGYSAREVEALYHRNVI